MKIVRVVFESYKKVLERKNPAANKRPDQENQFWSTLLRAEQLPLFHLDKHKNLAGINTNGHFLIKILIITPSLLITSKLSFQKF